MFRHALESSAVTRQQPQLTSYFLRSFSTRKGVSGVGACRSVPLDGIGGVGISNFPYVYITIRDMDVEVQLCAAFAPRLCRESVLYIPYGRRYLDLYSMCRAE